jgi:hypothetical protein
VTAAFRQAWEKLSAEPTGDTGWNSLRVFPHSVCAIRAAVRFPERTPALLVELHSESIEAVIEYPSAKGFSVYPETLVPGRKGQARICLLLTDVRHAEEFAVLAEDVASSIASASSELDAVRAMLGRLHAWQQFLERHSDGLSIEEQTGLFAELIFLRWLFELLPIAEALDAWRGPPGGLRDFLLHACEIEIKGSTGLARTTFNIGHVAQLDETGLDCLLLCHVALSANDNGTNLPELITTTRDYVKAASSGLLEQLDRLLMQAGFLEIHAKRYQARRLTMRAISFFRIGGEFPRLRRSEMRIGIVDATYAVDLNACAPFKIDENIAKDLVLGRGD